MPKPRRVTSKPKGKRGHPPARPGRKAAQPGRSAPSSSVPTDLGTLLKETRTKKGLSQADLGRQSGVSPSTIIKIEQSQSARSDAVIRLAYALGQPVERWLELAGHKGVPVERIATILKQQRVQEPGVPARFDDPLEYFTRLCDELRSRGAPALACACFTTKPAAVGRPEIRRKLVDLIEAGMHFACVCPYPQPADMPPAYLTTKPSLVGYYSQVFGWVRQLVGELCRDLPEERRRQVVFFVPRSRGRSGARHEHELHAMRLVPPPLLLTEYQPGLIKFCAGTAGQPEKTELGAYVRSVGAGLDRWVVLAPRQGEDQERAEESRNLWGDFFGDILQAWQPHARDTFLADDRLVDWTRV